MIQLTEDKSSAMEVLHRFVAFPRACSTGRILLICVNMKILLNSNFCLVTSWGDVFEKIQKENIDSTFFIALAVLVLVFGLIGLPLEHENMTEQELSDTVYSGLQNNFVNENFSIFSDDKYTYVLYRADLKHGDYITTTLNARKKWGRYIIKGHTSYAADDSLISSENIIRFKKVPSDKITLQEKPFN